MKLRVLLISLAFTLARGNETTEVGVEEKPENIIANGYPAYEGKASYMVRLALEGDGNNVITMCGGAIIGNNWVLTAAQCLTRSYVIIHYGSNSRNSQFSYRVGRGDFHVPREWPSERDYDIGLIRTPYVEFTLWVNSVNLPNYNYEDYSNKWAVACGWGEQANGQLPNSLQCVDLEIMARESCSHYYRSLLEKQLCARTPGGKSTCGGDTGGPLVTYRDNVVVAVTSFFSPVGCKADHPAGFTNVGEHVNWISEITGIYPQ